MNPCPSTRFLLIGWLEGGFGLNFDCFEVEHHHLASSLLGLVWFLPKVLERSWNAVAAPSSTTWRAEQPTSAACRLIVSQEIWRMPDQSGAHQIDGGRQGLMPLRLGELKQAHGLKRWPVSNAVGGG